MNKRQKQHSGGRRPLSEDDATVTVSMKMTTGQRAKLALLGGAAWIRARIDRAKIKET